MLPLAFASPWLLAALLALPVIWWLLRVTPPAPRRIPFPPLRLLLGLVRREETPAKTPLWLILLRMTIAALVIFAAAHPLLHPQKRLAGGRGPLVFVVDNGWAAAADWPERQAALEALLSEAEREGRQIVLVPTAPTSGAALPLSLMRAADARAAVAAMVPQPWPVDRQAALQRIEALQRSGHLAGPLTAIWLGDGVAGQGANKDKHGGAALADYLAGHGSLEYLTAPPGAPPILLTAGNIAAKDLAVVLNTLPAPLPRHFEVRASGADGRLLTRRAVTLPARQRRLVVRLPMPNELRNQTTEITVEGVASAGSVLLADEHWRRRPVGIATIANPSGEPLLGKDYYIERALAPYTELRHGRAATLLQRRLAVLIYSDGGPNSPAEAAAIRRWVRRGGLLLRFAGPYLAAQSGEDGLLPVRLLRGGRTIGGALSWERPARLAKFAADSPFAGLSVPHDVTVSRQVLAEPDLDLAGRTWARLQDGTPLVTARKFGKGRIVLVHTTANPDWSNLCLSGLFVEMLRRIVAMSAGIPGTEADMLPPLETLDGFGRLGTPPPTARPLAGKAVATATVSPLHPPGFYGSADARHALNLSAGRSGLTPFDALPTGTVRATFGASAEVDLRPPLLVAAFALALLDLLISYGLRGLLRRRPAQIAVLFLCVLGAALAAPATAQADDAFALRATAKFHLAYVVTGDPAVDAVSRAGLKGLSVVLTQRTAVDPGRPMAIDIDKDDLVFFPLLYWPVTANEPPPSPQAVARINHYLETGGTILFDTRDGDTATPGPFGGGASAVKRLRRLVAGIRLPPLVPIPPDHVLTKSFYLLHDFPGRWDNGTLWVEPDGDDRANDGVSTVIVGDNDWAGAWAINDEGQPMFPCVPGGEEQREMAYRFGVNLVMYVLTGNYKDDQVHVPAILERLGQ
jgi:hypothetical protein